MNKIAEQYSKMNSVMIDGKILNLRIWKELVEGEVYNFDLQFESPFIDRKNDKRSVIMGKVYCRYYRSGNQPEPYNDTRYIVKGFLKPNKKTGIAINVTKLEYIKQ